MSHKVETKGGEEINAFSTGAVRGSDTNKPQFDYITPEFMDIHPAYDKDNKRIDMATYRYNNLNFTVFLGEPINFYLPFQETDTSMIPDILLNRLGGLFWRGAQKYSRDNWKKGMSMARTFSSLFRHVIYWWAGDTSEDHLAAIVWNATVLMWTEHSIAVGGLPDELADLGPMKGFKHDS